LILLFRFTEITKRGRSKEQAADGTGTTAAMGFTQRTRRTAFGFVLSFFFVRSVFVIVPRDQVKNVSAPG
jgi:hypothetical protein